VLFRFENRQVFPPHPMSEMPHPMSEMPKQMALKEGTVSNYSRFLFTTKDTAEQHESFCWHATKLKIRIGKITQLCGISQINA
jgi:hypothetical protein